jgi:anti-sigma factor RsiW
MSDDKRSDEISRREFALLLDEYVRGELPAEQARACARYLAAHPEAQREAHEARILLLTPAWQAAGNPPAGLLAQAMARVDAQLQAPARRKARIGSLAGAWRPALAWSGLAAAVVVGAALLWPSATPVVFADVIARLQEVGSLQVEGWVRGEDGRQVPYRQLLLADGTFRAEIGAPGQERVVAWRNGIRKVKDRDGSVYRSVDGRYPPDIPVTLRDVLENLRAFYSDEESVSHSYTFSREQLGDITRFTRRDRGSLGLAGSNRERSLDVDGDTSLPVASRVREMVGGEWLLMSELRFTAFDQEPPAGFLELAGPDLPLDDAARERLWFELGITPASIQVPAAMPPVGDVDFQVLGPADLPKGIMGGGYRNYDGGVAVVEIYDLDISGAVMMVSRLPVTPNPVATRKAWLRIRAKSSLPWHRQLAPLLHHYGLRAELTTRVASRNRYEFTMKGKALTPSRAEFPKFGTTDDIDGFHYSFRKTPLRDVVTTLMRNNSLTITAIDTLVFNAGAFATEVDADFHNPDRSWKTNREFLRDQFGIMVEVRNEAVTVKEITLFDAKQ